jgi:lipopolysaccharide/colanic/teichoic acid biosynthesis glycosyltransferase
MLSSYGSASLTPGSIAQASALVGGQPLLTAEQLIDLQSKRSRIVKRSGDIVFSLAVLTLGSPIYILLALLVKLTSRGPVFYVQQRVGRDYRSFGCIKFRTMRRDADRVLGVLLAESPDLAEEFRNDFKLKKVAKAENTYLPPQYEAYLANYIKF